MALHTVNKVFAVVVEYFTNKYGFTLWSCVFHKQRLKKGAEKQKDREKNAKMKAKYPRELPIC